MLTTFESFFFRVIKHTIARKNDLKTNNVAPNFSLENRSSNNSNQLLGHKFVSMLHNYIYKQL